MHFTGTGTTPSCPAQRCFNKACYSVTVPKLQSVARQLGRSGPAKVTRTSLLFSSSIPNDHKNVARVFGFSRAKYLRMVVLPYSLPHILTGMRLSMGVAWMVIVAAEMLAGGLGLGFFVWDSWNSLKVDRILSAILMIGLVGLVLDRIFDYAAQRTAYQGI